MGQLFYKPKEISIEAKIFLLEFICTAQCICDWICIELENSIENFIEELLAAKMIRVAFVQHKKKIISNKLFIRLKLDSLI